MQIAWTMDALELQRNLSKLLRFYAGNEPQMLAMMRAVGLQAMGDIQREAIQLARGAAIRGRRWAAVSPMTALFRRRGSAGKITNWADAAQRAARMSPLRDTGKLLASISPGGPGSVFRVGPMRVVVGTNDSRAAVLHGGGRTTFRWSAEKAKRFDANVRKTLPGPKPELTPTGRRSRAKKNWNPFYFAMRNFYKGKGDGKSYKVPARPIIASRPSNEQIARYLQTIGHWLERILRGA